MAMRGWWLKVRERLSLGLIAEILFGKFLLALGIGALLSQWLKPWAWWLIGLGLLIDGLTKWRWLKR